MNISFLTKLKVEFIRNGTWRLLQSFDVMVNNVVYSVPAGFETDFASVPRLPITFSLFGDIGHRSAVLHDFLYSGEVNVTREFADDVLRNALIEEGVSTWKARSMWLAVRLGGGSHFESFEVSP